MDKTTRIASTVAAVAIAAGTAVVYNDIRETDKFYDENPELIPMDLPTLNLPKLNLPTLNLPKIQLPEINTAVVIDGKTLEELNLPVAATYDKDRFEQWKTLSEDKKNLFKDKRNLSYDKSISIDSTAFQKWIEIHKEKQNYVLEKVPLEDGIKMIAEVTVPNNPEEYNTLIKNLEKYHKKGYNAVLLTFDTFPAASVAVYQTLYCPSLLLISVNSLLFLSV